MNLPANRPESNESIIRQARRHRRLSSCNEMCRMKASSCSDIEFVEVIVRDLICVGVLQLRLHVFLGLGNDAVLLVHQSALLDFELCLVMLNGSHHSHSLFDRLRMPGFLL